MDVTAPLVVVVPGGSSGIGRAVAHAVARRGDHVVLLARSPDPLADAAAECRTLGAASVAVHAVDVNDAPAVQAAVDAVLAQHGRVDVVVQSAGVAAYGRLEAIPVDVFDRVVATNIFGTANMLRAVLPGMRERDSGTFFFIGSLLGDITVPMMSPYVLSKWGIRGLARIVAQENRDRRGIRFTLVKPGGIDTPIYYAGATYSGHAGKPPPPVYSPEAVAEKVVAAFERPPRMLDVGFANPLMRFGFSVLPGVYDRIVGPAFDLLARERKNTPAGPGNVFKPHPGAQQQLRGRHRGLSRRS